MQAKHKIYNIHRNVTVMFLYLLSFDFISYIIYTYQSNYEQQSSAFHALNIIF